MLYFFAFESIFSPSLLFSIFIPLHSIAIPFRVSEREGEMSGWESKRKADPSLRVVPTRRGREERRESAEEERSGNG